MVPNPRVYNGWLWTGATVNSKWRFRKCVQATGEWIVADVAATLGGKDIQSALDAAEAAQTAPAAAPAAPASAAPASSAPKS